MSFLFGLMKLWSLCISITLIHLDDNSCLEQNIIIQVILKKCLHFNTNERVNPAGQSDSPRGSQRRR